jgi:thiopeptide-type bacteriocin biosynthesis protein
MDKLRFLPGLVLRSPLYSWMDFTPDRYSEIINDPDFRQAIYFASPGFCRILEEKKFADTLLSAKEKLTIAKYYNRMCFRPTPFGTCSAFTFTRWGADSSLRLDKDYKIHLQPDNEVATIVGKHLITESETATFHLNPTLYRQGHEFRFIRSVKAQTGAKLNFSLDSLDVTSLTSGVINFVSAGPQRFGQLIDKIIEISDCSFIEAEAALASLVNTQVLRADTDYNISGKDYFTRIFEKSNSLEQSFAVLLPEIVSSTSAAIDDIQKRGFEITSLLTSNEHKSPEKLFYCNTQRESIAGNLDVKYQDTLLAVINCLRRLVPTGKPAALDAFITDFARRFEGRKIPLMQVLDPDHGIGYGDLSVSGAIPELLAGIQFVPEKKTSSKIQWSATHQLIMQKWLKADPGKPIILNNDDLSALPISKLPLPPSLSIMFRVIEEGLQIEHCGGPSAISLIGRFTPFSPEICSISCEIAEREQNNNPGVTFAEIGQLSDEHVDNINKRENIYPYEIPVNSISLLNHDHQLPPSGLLVSVRDGEIILETATNGTRVIPRLSSAYNFSHNQLPLFRFLCDLQYQGTQNNLQLDMEQLFPEMPYYPRVQFGDTVLSPAMWHIKQENIRGMKPDDLRRFYKEKHIPYRIAVTHADQQLVFDIDNNSEALLFLQVTATMEHFILREFFLPSSKAVCHENGRTMVNQFITFLINEKTVYPEQPALPASIVNNKTKREFILGSGWLYLKIYCNPASANHVLNKYVLPAIKDLTMEAPIVWFFIRYSDPKPHLRLRIKIAETNTGPVIALFKKRISILVKDSIIREYQADTYRRELDRYGADIINVVEDFFHASSEVVCAFIHRHPEVDQQPYLAISSMMIMLNLALPDINDQVAFLGAVAGSMSREYCREKSVRVELDQKYREIKKIFSSIGDGVGYLKKMKLTGRQQAFIEAFRTILRKSSRFDAIRRQTLITDLIHMHLNRVFSIEPRKQEFVLYYFFHKYKISETYAGIKHLSVAAVHPG